MNQINFGNLVEIYLLIFLSPCFIHYRKDGVEISQYNCTFFYFNFYFCQFLLYLWGCLIRRIQRCTYYILLVKWNIFLSCLLLVMHLVLKSTSPDANIGTSPFSTFVFTWYFPTLFLSIILCLYYLTWVSYKQHIAAAVVFQFTLIFFVFQLECLVH